MRYNAAMAVPSTKPDVWTVTDLTRRIKRLLEDSVGYVWVSGEVSNLRVSSAGHAYFTLKDEQSQLDCVMFKGRASKLKFEVENGLEVIAYGQVTVYERRGNYQIICEELQPKGLGALQLAFEKLRAKLSAEGLFDEDKKKSLPLLPQRIGVVTSSTGAAIRDILNVINRRYAHVHIILCPARVQGDEAASEIAKSIKTLDSYGVDVMIVGRGGGSLEDLWPFNEEVVVRAVYNAKTPIISAVGHEIDFTLSDFAADVRAPTPSAAAELVVQEQEALAKRITQAKRQLVRGLQQRVEVAKSRLNLAKSSYVFKRPEELLRQRRQDVDELRARLDSAAVDAVSQRRVRVERAARGILLLSPQNQVHRAKERFTAVHQRLILAGSGTSQRFRNRLERLAGQLDALSPLAILSRGYALARRVADGSLLRSVSQVTVGEDISVRFGEGAVTAAVTETHENA